MWLAIAVVLVILGNLIDAFSTTWALAGGKVEANPLVKGVGLFWAKLGASLVESWLVLWIGGSVGFGLGLLLFIYYLLVAARNFEVI
jgi:hypothetical protein